MFISGILLFVLCCQYAVAQNFDRSNQGLTAVPSDIPTNTVNLFLKTNNIAEVSPATLTPLSNLEQIDMTGNQLSDFPDLCEVGSTLTTVVVSLNPMTAVATVRLLCLTKLSTFTAEGSWLTTFPDFSHNGATLQTLKVTHGRLISIPTQYVDDLVALIHLHLSANHLTTLPDLSASKTSLQTLHLVNNSLTSLPAWLNDMEVLTTLQFDMNSLTEFPDLCSLADSLKYFTQAGNIYTTFDASRVNCMQNLQQFQISYCAKPTTGALDFTLSKDTMKSLYMIKIGLTSLPDLSDLPFLEEIFIDNNFDLIIERDYFKDINWPSIKKLSMGKIANTEFPDISYLAGTLDTLGIASSKVTTLPPEVFGKLHALRTVDGQFGQFSVFPTTSPSDPAAMDVKLQNSLLDFCDCRNVWLKMLQEAGASVAVNNVDCGGELWYSTSVQHLINVCNTGTGKKVLGVIRILSHFLEVVGGEGGGRGIEERYIIL